MMPSKRRTSLLPPEPGVTYCGFIDMSGGRNDDACLAVAHRDADGRAVLDVVINQGQPASPRSAATSTRGRPSSVTSSATGCGTRWLSLVAGRLDAPRPEREHLRRRERDGPTPGGDSSAGLGRRSTTSLPRQVIKPPPVRDFSRQRPMTAAP